MAKVTTYLECSFGKFTFDAIFSTNISGELTITSHPVQEGADVSDHAFKNGTTITFDIGMSDVMQGINPDFPGDRTRSLNAYDALIKMRDERIPISVINKFGTFNNMLVKSVAVEDNKDTETALRASVTLLEVLVAKVGTVKVSARPDKTDESDEGNQKAQNLNETWAYTILKNAGIIKE